MTGKNKMRELAALVGVELGEPFEIVGRKGQFRITKRQFESYWGNGVWQRYAGDLLMETLAGKFEVRRGQI